MVEDRVQRRLAAIFAADVVGYSRLMGVDEESALRTLQSYREIIGRLIGRHEGRIFATGGDSVLAEFASPVEAVRCAMAIQEELTVRNTELVEDRQMHFRIGINLGDVMAEGDDLLGDGVNIAARLESIAEPGGICISGSVFDQVRNKLPIGFEDIGPQKVKNIAEPISAYRLAPDRGPVPASVKAAALPGGARRWAMPAIVAAVLVIVAAGGVAMWRPWTPTVEPASVERMASALPDRPSIAVLPFTNISDDPGQEYFADGMSEDLITDLSKISGLLVIARNSTFAYKGKSLDLRQVAKELGVRYVLEGSVRKAGRQVRINAQLIDATTGGHLWAERYDGDLEDVFGLQDKVTAKIVTVLAVKLAAGEQERIVHKETENTEAYDTFLKGWEQYQRQRPESFRQAIALFEKATKLDPEYSRAYAALSATYWQVWKRTWYGEVGRGWDSFHQPQFLAEEFLEKAMLDPTPLALQTAASMLAQQGRHADAINEGERAIALDPNDADSYVALAGALSLAGQFEKSLELIERAMRLNPHYPPSYLYELGLARFGMEQFADAAMTLEKATALNPDDRWSRRILLAAYGHLGRGEDAAKIFAEAEKNWRGFDPLSVRGVAFWYPFKQPADAERLAEGLRQADVPD
jgi:TolB-like protein/class 3 adenylate cyclase